MASKSLKLLLGSSLVVACGAHADPRVYQLKAPVTRDQDLDLVTIPCKPKQPCGPQLYESSFAWDAADNEVFRPISEGFLLKKGGSARNVNAFDEVPDSAWFTNCIGADPKTPMTREEVAAGYCKYGKSLSPDLPDGGWLIELPCPLRGYEVHAQDRRRAARASERRDEHGDALLLRRQVVGAVRCRRLVQALSPQTEAQPRDQGERRPFEEVRREAPRGGAEGRLTTRRALSRRRIAVAPSDNVPHEHRRDLRSARIMAAWMNHFDSREQNSMETWLDDEDLAKEQTDAEEGRLQKQGKKEPGKAEQKNPAEVKAKDDAKKEAKAEPTSMHAYIRHWYIDLGDCFGSEWTVDGFSRRFGHSYMLDWGQLGADFVTFGAVERPWDRNTNHFPFGYYDAKDFQPDNWKNEYPNAAYSNVDEGDSAWITRIISRFTKEQVAAIVDVGDWTKKEEDRAYLLGVLLDRQQQIEHRFFSKLSPVSDVVVEKDRVCATNLARKKETWPEGAFTYRAAVKRGTTDKIEPLAVTAEADGKLCVPLTALAPAGGEADDATSRYVVARITNGSALGPIAMHLYDLGPGKGLTLVGIERPEK